MGPVLQPRFSYRRGVNPLHGNVSWGLPYYHLNRYAQSSYYCSQGFDFLHEHRIAHTDFLEQNTGINVLVDTRGIYLMGLRDPSVTRYAIYDFGGSSIFPEDTVLEDVQSTEFFHFGLRGCETPPGPWNPFQVDILFLGTTLQRWVRVSNKHLIIKCSVYLNLCSTLKMLSPKSALFLTWWWLVIRGSVSTLARLSRSFKEFVHNYPHLSWTPW